MIRHISVFFLKEEQREDKLPGFIEDLKEMGRKLEGDVATNYSCGANNMNRPPKGTPGIPEFGDAVQVFDFIRPEYAADYGHHPVHVAMAEATGSFIEKVVAIEFETED